MPDEKLYVGRPNIGNRDAFLSRVSQMLDRRWLSNDGPFVREFESRIADMVGVKHAIAVCNATVGLELAIKALDLKGEVILPSYTFVATAHSLQWQGISPVFADMDERSHNIDPARIEALISPKTTGIIGVHVWGRPCDADAIEEIAARHGLKVMYDAAHAFGCSRNGKMIGGFGSCEVFSFHATKFINCFEGGAIVTNDDELASRLKLMRNFGFVDFDKVVYLGVNGKMSEVCAAMGLTSLESMEEIVGVNRRNYNEYKRSLDGVEGVSVIDYSPSEKNNYQYIVLEVDPAACARSRDEIVSALHQHDVIARKYFWPGCHKMEPYATLQPDASEGLRVTERVAANIIVLPTGQSISVQQVGRVCQIIRDCIGSSWKVK